MDAIQSEVFAFLSRPDAWPNQPRRVETIDTHGARVFLAGDEVLKVKRAVRLPYLDFSALAARRYYCEREIALNRAGAAGIYRDVVAITREASGGLAIGGRGEPVEWAVRMHRFAQEDVLKAAVHRGTLPPGLAGDLAEAVFRYHQAAPHAPASAENIAEVATGLLSSLARFQTIATDERLQRLRERLSHHLTATQELRATRARKGFVRRCHGDLHTGNIVLWQGKPVLFDALEFDEALATIDTLYDLAFLLMDLDRQGALAAANEVMNRYLWRSRDLCDVEGLALLPLYLGLRAGVRAMVGFDRAASLGLQVGDLVEQAQQTLDLALRNLSPQPARLIAIGGLSGTGKTTLARALAPSAGAVPGALHLRTDMERKALAGADPTTRLPASAYTKEASAAVYARTLERAQAALAARHVVILDAVFADATERHAAEDLAHTMRVPFTGLWLEGTPATLTARVATRTGDASDATAAVVSQQLLYETGVITWQRLDASGVFATTLAAARNIL